MYSTAVNGALPGPGRRGGEGGEDRYVGTPPAAPGPARAAAAGGASAGHIARLRPAGLHPFPEVRMSGSAPTAGRARGPAAALAALAALALVAVAAAAAAQRPAGGAAAGAPAAPQVRTADGVVAGTVAASGVRLFRGIPFAAPPVRELRWRPPQPAARWRACAPPTASRAVHAGARVRRHDVPQRRASARTAST
jgi:hypothetical protein